MDNNKAGNKIWLGFIGGGHIAPGQEARLKAAGAAHVFSDMATLPELVAEIRGQTRRV